MEVRRDLEDKMAGEDFMIPFRGHAESWLITLMAEVCNEMNRTRRILKEKQEQEDNDDDNDDKEKK